MKRVSLLIAITAGVLALMFGHADAITVSFFDSDTDQHVEISPLPSEARLVCGVRTAPRPGATRHDLQCTVQEPASHSYLLCQLS